MAIDPRVDIGHVHLKVADLERALGFYCGILGFELQQQDGRPGAAFVAAGSYHHHIGLNTWQSKDGSPPPPGTTGLFHTAIRYPDRATLADALRRVLAAGHPIDGASDHGVSEAIYLRDPDENGVELYRDRPEEEWPRGDRRRRSRCSARRSISTRCSPTPRSRLSGKQCRSTDDDSVGDLAVRCARGAYDAPDGDGCLDGIAVFVEADVAEDAVLDSRLEQLLGD